MNKKVTEIKHNFRNHLVLFLLMIMIPTILLLTYWETTIISASPYLMKEARKCRLFFVIRAISLV
jgi:hypothetical protein